MDGTGTHLLHLWSGLPASVPASTRGAAPAMAIQANPYASGFHLARRRSVGAWATVASHSLLSAALRDSSSRTRRPCSWRRPQQANGAVGEVMQLLQSERGLIPLRWRRGSLARARWNATQMRSTGPRLVAAAARSPLGERLMLLRAVGPARRWDSAAALYIRAAGRLPQVADWLRLHAHGHRRQARRAKLYATSRDPLPQGEFPGRAPRTSGPAIMPSRAPVCGAGERLTSLRLRLALSPDRRSRAIRKDFFALISGRV